MKFQPVSKESPLILASASPRRKRLLEQINLPFRSVLSHVEEVSHEGEPRHKTLMLSEKKARAVSSEYGRQWILGADTLVVIGKSALGKPADPEEARSMLSVLSGKEHRVITGFSLLDPAGRTAHAEATTTLVKIRPLTEEEIGAYVATGEPFGKAGSYAIQGIGAFMVESIRGSYTNVVGLPLCALIKALVEAGALKNFPLP